MSHYQFLLGEFRVAKTWCKIIHYLKNNVTSHLSNICPYGYQAELAVGNIAYAINTQNECSPLVSLESYMSICEVTYAAMSDKNEKLAAGAIRSIGHLLNGFFHLSAHNDVWFSKETDMIKLAGLTTTHLARKINLCIDSHSSPEAKSKLTWKQRMNMSKQAWGSCHSLGHMLTTDMLRSQLYAHFVPTLKAMIRCINEHDLLNQKIVSAAAGTLNIIPDAAWYYYSEETHILTNCVNASVRYLFKNKRARDATPIKVAKELNSLLARLLVVAKHIDVTCSEEILEFLYGWMSTRSNILVTNEVNAFELVQVALTQDYPNDDRFDVSIIQKFDSRASQERRKRELQEKDSNTTNEESLIDDDEL
mmetsp:Transcript_9155/g.13692  ORF Transcript_9155/g.13692 Transcript_9155/m.13692 type:complete len:364 (-) Transcript_9155:889-1980(-)